MARGPKFQSMMHHLLSEHLDHLGPPRTAEEIASKPAIPKLPFIPIDLEADDLLSLSMRSPTTSLSGEAQPEEKDASSSIIDISSTAGHQIKTEQGNIWVEGNSLLCECPDCSAPMTVRIWLQLADCWRCQASISLTEEQVRQAEALLGKSSPETEPHVPAQRTGPGIEEALTATVPDEESAVELPDSRQRELQRLTEKSVFARFVRRGFNLTPAWVISFLLHLIAILILALIVLNGEQEEPTIVLSTTIDSVREPGGLFRIENPLDQLQDDLAMANQLDVSERELRDVLIRAEQDARELQIDPQPTAPQIDINVLRRNVTTRPDQRMSFDARDPRVRSEIVLNEGGTLMTEAAVARGLRWLASVQNHDGSWSLRDYKKHDRKGNRGDAMGTSLALLPFLGAGQTHEFGKYKNTVNKGLAWLLKNQEDDGDLRADYNGQAGMYAHGQAAIVLCEVLAMTGDEQFRTPAQNAIRFIEKAQHNEGGWRYRPGEEGDTSVFGWQLMAIQSARAPRLGLQVDKATLQLADYFLDLVAVSHRRAARQGCPEGALYGYQPGKQPTDAMTAEAILCRMYLGWKRDDPRMIAAIDWLIDKHLPDEDEMNIYYWYYGTQAMHHFGGRQWERWNSRMRQLLIGSQETRGRYPGSWNPSDFRWGGQGGRIYTTSLSVCTLEVYYRHLPLFKQIKLDDE